MESSDQNASAAAAKTKLRIMTFNIWRSGGLSLDRCIDAMKASNADVIGLQECSPDARKAIAKALKGFDVYGDHNGHAIFSRFPIDDELGTTDNQWGGLGATLRVSKKQRVHVFDAHLHWTEYGPYYLREGKTDKYIEGREREIRMPGLEELLDELIDPALKKGEPVYLVGDFNAPSHLDYTSLRWPTSIACEERGFKDSYRAVHPPKRKYDRTFRFDFDEPGITWTPLTAEEPHGAFDRIDLVLYAGPTKAISSMELDGRNCIADWPSDHRAVLSEFEI